MNGFMRVVAVLSLVLVSSVASAKTKKQMTPEFVPGEIVVRVRDGGTGVRLQSVMTNRLMQRFGANAIVQIREAQTDAQLATLKLAPNVDVQQAIQTLSESADVEFAEPNYIYRKFDDGTPDDPEFSKLWGLSNTGQADSSGQKGNPGSDINVLPLWKEGIRGSHSVTVAVIDTGVDWTHPDLKDNLYTNTAEIAGNGKDDDGNGFVDDVHGWNFVNNTANSSDDHDHGTHSAGTIGGTGNNAQGVVGVNWNVKILPIKFLSASGGGTLAAAVESINYARLMKVDIMSNSWGGGGFSQALEKSIKDARDAGILFVAAAGNETNDNDANPTYPATYNVDNVVSVAALDNRDQLASFSNWGAKKVHVGAPGVRILSTTKGGRYNTFSGTSMATPHVAGIAALMLANNNTLTYSDIKSALIETSVPVQGLRRKTLARGRVSAYNAVKGIVPPSPFPDESAWKTIPYAVESAHPYSADTNQTWTISRPGAKFIRVVFSRFDVEKGYDFVTIKNASGGVVEKLSGVLPAGHTSDYAEGESLSLTLTSDGDVHQWGFKVEQIQVIE